MGATAAGMAGWGVDTGAPVHLDGWMARDSSHTHTGGGRGAAQRDGCGVCVGGKHFLNCCFKSK